MNDKLNNLFKSLNCDLDTYIMEINAATYLDDLTPDDIREALKRVRKFERDLETFMRDAEGDD